MGLFILGNPTYFIMYLKRITTRNIQNHAEVVVDISEHGVIVFTGNNSNGKSVIVKVTKALVTNTIRKPRKRASLINRDKTYGEVIYERSDGAVLTLHLDRAANVTYVKLDKPNADPIIRYLADKTYPQLVREFGFHFDESSGISLHFAEADESLLFYKTSSRINSSIVQTATSDSTAETVLENFTATVKQARQFRDEYNKQIRVFKETVAELKISDEEELLKRKEQLEKLYHILSTIHFPRIPEVKPVPKIYGIDVKYPTLPNIVYPTVINVKCVIPDITNIAAELKALGDYKCPTCGRGFDCDCTNISN